MNISLDFDDTYTRDPGAWNRVIAILRGEGHQVYCVTMRRPDEGMEVLKALEGRVDEIFFTSRFAKQKYMYDRGIRIDVWIDDSPNWILNSASDATTCDHCGCPTNTWHQQHKGNCPNIPF